MFKFDDTFTMFVRKDIERGVIPMLLGEPGIGKSSWLIALAEQMHTRCFVLACNQLADKADLTGARLVPTTDASGNTSYKQVFYPHAVIHDAIEYAAANPRETPILFLDELNRTTPDVTSEALSIPTLRSIGSMSLPDNLRVVIAGNDKGNVTSLDDASLTRFSLYSVMPDTQTFLAVNPELNPFIKAVLSQHPDVIFCRPTVTVATGSDDGDDSPGSIEEILNEGDKMEQITTPRTISALSEFLNTFSNQELLSTLAITYNVDGQETTALGEAIIGHVGNTRFTKLLLDEISRNISNVANQANVQALGKPLVYDQMKAQTSVDDLTRFVQTLTDNDKSGCMLYALYEKKDNTLYIQTLAANMTNLSPDDGRKLMSLLGTQSLDVDNVQALRTSNTPFAMSVSAILDYVG